MGQNAITKINGFHFDDVLWEYCSLPEIVKYVECVTGPDIKTIHTMVVNKPPDIGPSSRHPFHQDLHYFPMRPAEKIVGSWTAMERVFRENGCLSVLPGSHRRDLMRHHYPSFVVNAAYHGIQDISQEELDKRVHLPMEAGDTAFFHPCLFHGSGWNRTQNYRKAISSHYASTHCHYIEVAGTSQAEIGEEVVELARKYTQKRGVEVTFSYQDIWSLKSRLVQGKEDSL